MARRAYPRIADTGFRKGWQKEPKAAPFCCVPSCGLRATHQPDIQVNWFRGDDEGAGPCCKAHSTDVEVLLQATAAWRAENKAKHEAAEQKGVGRKLWHELRRGAWERA